MGRERQTFGRVLRERRIAWGFSLRKFAALAGVSPTYLSQVEQGKVVRPPTAERVRRMAELLGENPDEWIGMAGRMPEDLPGIIQQRPTELPELLREASGLTVDELKLITERIRRMRQKGREP